MTVDNMVAMMSGEEEEEEEGKVDLDLTPPHLPVALVEAACQNVLLAHDSSLIRLILIGEHANRHLDQETAPEHLERTQKMATSMFRTLNESLSRMVQGEGDDSVAMSVLTTFLMLL
eukprot:760178-Hanusia_phi.AAC.1